MKSNNLFKKQNGFALLEVMIAALILTVGSVAYLKLQRMGLQYGFNNTARSQGTTIIENFIEQLRSNVGIIRTSKSALSGSFLGSAIKAPTKSVNCNSEINPEACAKSIFSMHNYLISEQMRNIAPDNNTRLCYVESASESGLIRVTFQWIDNSEEGRAMDFTKACPTFNANTNQNNSVTIYAQL